MKKALSLLHLLTAILLLSAGANATAQNRHFYHRGDIGSGNAYMFVGTNLITAFANYLSHDILFDNSFNYTFYDCNLGGTEFKTKANNIMGLKAKELFNDFTAGVKLGYKSDSYSSFNWGIYGSFHYKINQFQLKPDGAESYANERMCYLKPGVGAFVVLGSIESDIKVQIEGALRYALPIAYKGMLGDKTDMLDSGIQSHFALKLGGAHDFSGGVFVDINHFDFYKDMPSDSKFKAYTIGVTLTITPKRGERLY